MLMAGKLFQKIDGNHSGGISKDEFYKFLLRYQKPNECEK